MTSSPYSIPSEPKGGGDIPEQTAPAQTDQVRLEAVLYHMTQWWPAKGEVIIPAMFKRACLNLELLVYPHMARGSAHTVWFGVSIHCVFS